MLSSFRSNSAAILDGKKVEIRSADEKIPSIEEKAIETFVDEIEDNTKCVCANSANFNQIRVILFTFDES